jgi:hypothetical protein
MALRPFQFNILCYQASFHRRARSRWLGAAVTTPPSLSGRGCSGLAPRRCCPRARRVVSCKPAAVAGAAPASRSSPPSKRRCCLYPGGTRYPGTPHQHVGGTGQTATPERTPRARLRARRRSSPWLQPGAFSREEWVSRLAANMWKSVCLTPLQRCPDLWRYRTKTPKLRFCTLRNVGSSAAAHRTAVHARLITQWKACAESIGR